MFIYSDIPKCILCQLSTHSSCIHKSKTKIQFQHIHKVLNELWDWTNLHLKAKNCFLTTRGSSRVRYIQSFDFCGCIWILWLNIGIGYIFVFKVSFMKFLYLSVVKIKTIPNDGLIHVERNHVLVKINKSWLFNCAALCCF